MQQLWQSKQCCLKMLCFTENSPERSVCTAEDPTSRDVNKGFCNSAESEEESFAPLKPSSPGSPASLFNHISVLAHTNGNALRLDANFGKSLLI